MNNLHRELAPISAAAWADLEQEARRTCQRHLAGRRVVDVPAPGGPDLAAVTTGHLDAVAPPAEGVLARRRRSQPLVELRVPFTVDRQQVDDVERGAKDTDWQPVKDAARQIAFAEDRAVFQGYPAAPPPRRPPPHGPPPTHPHAPLPPGGPGGTRRRDAPTPGTAPPTRRFACPAARRAPTPTRSPRR